MSSPDLVRSVAPPSSLILITLLKATYHRGYFEGSYWLKQHIKRVIFFVLSSPQALARAWVGIGLEEGKEGRKGRKGRKAFVSWHAQGTFRMPRRSLML